MDRMRRWRSKVKLKTVFIGIAALYIGTFAFVLPIKCKGLGHSAYFDIDDAEKEINRQNHVRLTHSLHYLNIHRNFNEISEKRGRRGIRICASILTTKRYVENGYLFQTVAKLAKEIKNSRFNFDLTILNADIPPEVNRDFMKLKKFYAGPEFVSHNTTMQRFLLNRDKYDKHRLDVIEALRVCDSEERYDYALLLEDDAFAGDDFANMLDYVIGRLPKDGSFGYVKLYHPEKWQGFGNDTILEVVLIAVLSFLGFFGLGILLIGTNNFDNVKTIAVNILISVLLMCYVLAFCYTFSRQHLLEIFKLWRYTHFIVDASSCCTSAVLYPTRVLFEYIHFLETEVSCNQSYAIDLVPYDYFKSKGLDRLQVIPNLFFHIGYASSVDSAHKLPWGFFHLFQIQF